MSAPGFWDEPAAAQKVAQELTKHKEGIGQYTELENRYNDAVTLWQLGLDESDDSIYAEVADSLQRLDKDVEQDRKSVV